MAPDAAGGRMRGRGGSPPLSLVSADPRIFGVVPAMLALLLGSGGVAAGVVLLLVGRWPAGLVAAALGAVLITFALDSARRWPSSPIARGLVRSADAVGSRLGLAGVFAGTWSEAVREVVRLRAELRALKQQRDREQFELGGAAAREDDGEMDDRRTRIESLDGRIEEAERAVAEAVEGARARVSRERASIKRTEPFAVEEIDPSGRKTAATVRRDRA
jgi:hypothetical protein